MTHTVEVSTADEPRDSDWRAVPVEVALGRTQALDLVQTLSASGVWPHVRAMSPQGVRVLQMSRVTT